MYNIEGSENIEAIKSSVFLINIPVIATTRENQVILEDLSEENILEIYEYSKKYKNFLIHSDDRKNSFIRNFTILYPKTREFILLNKSYATEINYTDRNVTFLTNVNTSNNYSHIERVKVDDYKDNDEYFKFLNGIFSKYSRKLRIKNLLNINV